jgi:orotate phosphoribosyltransferase
MAAEKEKPEGLLYSIVSQSIMQAFRDTGAYLTGHFRLTSGLHSNEYLQCARVLQHPVLAERLGRELAVQLTSAAKSAAKSADGSPLCDLVASPALGGLIIGHEVARAIGCRFVFTERDNGKMVLRRGFSVQPGETAVVVEDVVTTGGSTREVMEVLRAAGARVLAVGSIIDRTGGTVDLGVPRAALAVLNTSTWQAEECPLCRDGVPVEKPGSRPGA